MRIRMGMKALVLVGGLIMVGLASVMSQDVGAATVPSGSRLEQKMMYQGVYRCYGYDSDKSAMKDNFPLRDYKGPGSLLENGSIKVPSITSSDGSSALTCNDLLGNNGSVFKLTAKNPPQAASNKNAGAVEDFVESMGYTIDNEIGDNPKCFELHYQVETMAGEETTNAVCQLSDKTLKTYDVHIFSENVFGIGDGGKSLCFVGLSDYDSKKHCQNINGEDLSEDFLKRVIESESPCQINGSSGGKCFLDFSQGKNVTFTEAYPATPLNVMTAEIAKGNAGNIAVNFLSTLEGNSEGKYQKLEDVKILDDRDHLDKRILYQSYVVNYYQANIDCSSSYGDTVQWFDKDSEKDGDNNKTRACHYTRPSLHDGENVVRVGSDGFLEFSSDPDLALGFDGIIKALNDDMETEYSNEAVAPYADYIASNFNSSVSYGSDILKDCYDAGIVSVSWIVCPAISNMTYAADFMDRMIQDWLTVDVNLYDQDSATYVVWEVMRNIANVVMIIILMFIVFSQLTGLKIDNYGIKKMLPKLITMAVLVNLSFVVCSLAVDLSNVLGVGLRNFFAVIGGGLESTASGTETITVGGIVAGLFAAVGVGGAMAGTIVAAAAVGLGPMMAIVILLALVSIIFAILLFFVMLGARMLIVIGCTALAPIAFVLYILPNTQKFYQKWWGIFKAMLVMYPICGAVGGISFLIKKMVETGDGMNIWMAVVAMIAPFLPFFMLPLMLKSAMGMLGTVGTALSNMGQKVTSGAAKGVDAIQRTGAYQEASSMARKEAMAKRSNRLMTNMKRKYGDENGKIDPNKLSEREQYKLASSFSATKKNRQEDNAIKAALFENMYGDLPDDKLVNEFEKRLKNGDKNGDLEAVTSVLIGRLTTKGAASKISGIVAAETGEDWKANEKKILSSLKSLRQVMQDNSDFNLKMRIVAPDVTDLINAGKYIRLSEVAPIANKMTNEDIASLSTDTLRRARRPGGWLGDDRANEVANSDEPSVRSKLDKEKIKILTSENSQKEEDAEKFAQLMSAMLGGNPSSSQVNRVEQSTQNSSSVNSTQSSEFNTGAGAVNPVGTPSNQWAAGGQPLVGTVAAEVPGAGEIATAAAVEALRAQLQQENRAIVEAVDRNNSGTALKQAEYGDLVRVAHGENPNPPSPQNKQGE